MTPFPLPLFLPALLLLLALLAYLFRRLDQLTPAVAGLAVGGLSLWLIGDAPVEGVVRLFGIPLRVDLQAEVVRSDLVFRLAPSAIPILVFVLLLTGIALLLTAATSHSRHFPSIALLLSAGYSLLLLLTDAPIRPLLLIPLILAILTSLGIFALQAGQLGDTFGPLRTLMPPLFAFPFFILASWYMDSLAINPQDAKAGLAAANFLALGFLLLLAPVPFHSAGLAVAESAPPLAFALLTLLYQLVVLTLLFHIIALYPLIVEPSGLSIWLTSAGLLTAVWAGLAAAGSSHPGRLWGYAMLHDWGLILLMLAAPGEESWSLVLFLFGLRSISVFAAAIGLTFLRSASGSLDASRLRGAGRLAPWTTSAYVLSGLGLAGFPLSAGFTGHWAALQTMAETDWRIAGVVLLASGGVVIGFIRLIRILYDPEAQPPIPAERTVNALIAIAAILVVSGAAIAPQILSGPISWALMAFRR